MKHSSNVTFAPHKKFKRVHGPSYIPSTLSLSPCCASEMNIGAGVRMKRRGGAVQSDKALFTDSTQVPLPLLQ